MKKYKAWILASRPKTLWASFSPVLIGCAMALADEVFHWPSACAAWLGAVLIQIGTNFVNDYFDFKKGADTEERVGPQRAMQSGLISPKAMKNGIVLIFLLAVLATIPLILRAGLPIFFIGTIAIICGFAYTAGPYPLAYQGLGDIFVLFFFGPVAVAGTYYVQALEINSVVLLAGLAPGFLSVALLTVNNLRDIEQDKKANKNTLAVRFGATFAKVEYVCCILISSILPLILYLKTGKHPFSIITILVALLGVRAMKNVWSKNDSITLNRTLAFTSKLSLIYGVLFSVSWQY